MTLRLPPVHTYCTRTYIYVYIYSRGCESAAGNRFPTSTRTSRSHRASHFSSKTAREREQLLLSPTRKFRNFHASACVCLQKEPIVYIYIRRVHSDWPLSIIFIGTSDITRARWLYRARAHKHSSVFTCMNIFLISLFKWFARWSMNCSRVPRGSISRRL